MIYAAIYDSITGEIFKTVGDIEQRMQLQAGDLAWIECGLNIADDTHYVDTQTLGINEKTDYTLDALPIPCTLTIEGIEYHCTEQPTFNFAQPGEYLIEVDAGPAYYKREFIYHAD